MNRATPEMRSVAKHLMDYEVPRGGPIEANAVAAFPVTEKLRSHLAALMGLGGFRALLSRALVLASAEAPWLSAVHVKADGTLEGLEPLHARIGPAEFLEGRVVLLAQLLGLLVAFIGPNLTSRLAGEIWPQIPLNGFDFGNGDQNEKAD
jgi:hypothetical protein